MCIRFGTTLQRFTGSSSNLETTGVEGILTTLTQGVYHSATAASIAEISL
jgi:hypothetical protein